MVTKRSLVVVVFLSFILTAGAAVAARGSSVEEYQSREVGLATFLRGNVVYQKKGGENWKAALFLMKVRLGDNFRLLGKSTLRIVYFKNGRVETWTGPSAFRVHAEGGELEEGESPEIGRADVSVSQEIEVAANVLQKSGAWVSRGMKEMSEEEKELVMGRYRALKKAAEQGDPLPEIYLFSVLIKHGDYETAERYLRDALRDDPHSPELREMLSYLEDRK